MKLKDYFQGYIPRLYYWYGEQLTYGIQLRDHNSQYCPVFQLTRFGPRVAQISPIK